MKRLDLSFKDFFKNRTLYYDNLMRVRTHNNMEQWLKFFLTGVITTAEKGIQTFDEILQLQKNLEVNLKDLGSRSGDAFRLVEYLYRKPVVNAVMVREVIGKTLQPAYNLIAEFEKREILKEITGGERGKLYMFEDYVNLFKTD